MLLKRNDQFMAFCLDLSLAAQAGSEAEARSKLESMIHSYLEDALVGEDREHAADLLSRKSPFWMWVRYYIGSTAQWWRSRGIRQRGAIPYRELMPLAPAH
jgi:hypothetical protein